MPSFFVFKVSYRDRNPFKSSNSLELGVQMDEQLILTEIMHDNLTEKKHDLKKQTELHEKIRNDEDYDDWDYGTEPVYGKITM